MSFRLVAVDHHRASSKAPISWHVAGVIVAFALVLTLGLLGERSG